MTGLSLLHTLQTGTLWFSRIACASDLFDGRLPPVNKERWAEMLHPGYETIREMTGVNCWHMEEGESAAMWAIYGGREFSVAIESRFNRLTRSFVVDENHWAYKNADVFAGAIRYLDPEADVLPENSDHTAPNAFVAVMWKRRAYAFENELRVVFAPSGHLKSMFLQGAVNGWAVDVDLIQLIERIIVAPGTPDWQFDVLRRAVGERFDVAFSRLDASPETGKSREVMKPGWIRLGRSQ